MDDTHVAIVGGGLSGLHAARMLAELQVDFLVIEGQDRLGGRILTAEVPWPEKIRARYDLGPTWFWPAFQQRFPRLIDELGLSTFEQPARGELVFEESPRTRRRMAAGSVVAGSMRVMGGMGQVVEAMEERLPPQRIVRGRPVLALRHGGDSITLDLACPGGGRDTLRARHVISTLPPRLLARQVAFEPALPGPVAASWAGTPTWMAGHAKFVAVYDTPHWNRQGLSGQAHSRAGPLAETYDASTLGGPPAIFGFVGEPASARGDGDLRVRALAQLARLFGPKAAEPTAMFLKDWAAEPFVATPEDSQGLRAHPEYGFLEHPPAEWVGRFWLAGSEAARNGGGYLEGALESAERAVAGIMASP